MNTIEHDLHTMFSLQAEAMEVPPVGTLGASVGHIHTVSTVPGRRWMLAAAAVVLVVGGGLAFAQRQPAEPPMAGTIDELVDLPAAPGNDAGEGSSGDGSTTTDGTSPGTTGTGTGAGESTGDGAGGVGSTGGSEVAEPGSSAPATGGGSAAPKAPKGPEADPNDGTPEDGGDGGDALPPVCGTDGTKVHIGSSTEMLVGQVGEHHELEFYVVDCTPTEDRAYNFEATLADPPVAEIVKGWKGSITLHLLTEGIGSVKMHITDAAGNTLGTVVVPIEVRSAHPGDGDDGNPGDTDPGDIVCVVPLPAPGDGDDGEVVSMPDGSTIGYEPCDPGVTPPGGPDEPTEPGVSDDEFVKPDCELPVPLDCDLPPAASNV